MADLLVVGSLTCDRVDLLPQAEARRRRWTQPGGAGWQAGIALGAAGQAGP